MSIYKLNMTRNADSVRVIRHVVRIIRLSQLEVYGDCSLFEVLWLEMPNSTFGCEDKRLMLTE